LGSRIGGWLLAIDLPSASALRIYSPDLRVIETDFRLESNSGTLDAMANVLPELDELLRSAISQRRQIRFRYQGKERISEPHDYGLHKGRALLLTYQLAGESNSGGLPAWRWIEVAGMQELEMLRETFSGGRPAPSGKHHRWDELFVRVAEPE
jgi:hypothetical protein